MILLFSWLNLVQLLRNDSGFTTVLTPDFSTITHVNANKYYITTTNTEYAGSPSAICETNCEKRVCGNKDQGRSDIYSSDIHSL